VNHSGTKFGRSSSSKAKTKNWLGLSRPVERRQKVVVVGDVDRMPDLAVDRHILTERDPFELRRNHGRIQVDRIARQDVDDVEEERFGDGPGRDVRLTCLPTHVVREPQVDLEDLLEPGFRAWRIGAALPVALVHEELVIVDRQDVADGGLRGSIELIRVLVRPSGPDVDGDDSGDAGPDVAAVLNQRALHRADQHLPIAMMAGPPVPGSRGWSEPGASNMQGSSLQSS
jgi:hypothetical protein